jgi:hypothetical protein
MGTAVAGCGADVAKLVRWILGGGDTCAGAELATFVDAGPIESPGGLAGAFDSGTAGSGAVAGGAAGGETVGGFSTVASEASIAAAAS